MLPYVPRSYHYVGKLERSSEEWTRDQSVFVMWDGQATLGPACCTGKLSRCCSALQPPGVRARQDTRSIVWEHQSRAARLLVPLSWFLGAVVEYSPFAICLHLLTVALKAKLLIIEMWSFLYAVTCLCSAPAHYSCRFIKSLIFLWVITHSVAWLGNKRPVRRV